MLLTPTRGMRYCCGLAFGWGRLGFGRLLEVRDDLLTHQLYRLHHLLVGDPAYLHHYDQLIAARVNVFLDGVADPLGSANAERPRVPLLLEAKRPIRVPLQPLFRHLGEAHVVLVRRWRVCLLGPRYE